MKPNKVNIAKWVAALRSGEHEQGTGALNEGGKKCCLGVACEIAKDELGLRIIKEEHYDDSPPRLTYNGDGGYLPGEVQEWLGLNSANPLIGVDPENEQRGIQATYANDGMKLSFAEIADRITKTYLSD